MLPFIKCENTQFHASHLCINNSGNWSVASASLNGPKYFLNAGGIGELKECSASAADKLEEESIKVKIFYPENAKSQTHDCQRVIGYYSAALVSELVEVPADVWSLGQQCVKIPTEENISTFKNKLSVVPDGKGLKLVNEIYEKKFSQSPYIGYDIKKSLPVGTPVNVWVGRSLAEPIPTPHASLLEIAPTVQICLDHSKKPALCFSDIQLKQAFKAVYHSIEEYVDLWSKVFLAEAAFDGVDDVKTIQMLRGVALKWEERLVRPETSIDDVSYVLGVDKTVSFEVSKAKKQIFDFITINIGDLVCARYIDQVPSSIYHFVIYAIHKIRDEDDDDDNNDNTITVELKAVGDHSCLVSPKMKTSLEQDQRLCDLQIIKMPKSFR